MTFTEPSDLLLENGLRESLPVTRGHSRLPADVPLGYHTAELLESGRRVSLIVAPDKCHLPDGLRIWAWAVQLYSLRSRRSWGIGDFGDPAGFADVAQRQGSRLLLVNPLHAASPVLPQQPSPYSPTTRRYLNPLYLACESVPGARALPQFAQLAAAGRALNEAPLIDRDRIFTLKMKALAALYKRFDGDPDFDAFLTSEGPAFDGVRDLLCARGGIRRIVAQLAGGISPPALGRGPTVCDVTCHESAVPPMDPMAPRPAAASCRFVRAGDAGSADWDGS